MRFIPNVAIRRDVLTSSEDTIGCHCRSGLELWYHRPRHSCSALVAPMIACQISRSIFLVCGVLLAGGCEDNPSSRDATVTTAVQGSSVPSPRVAQFCGHCHAFPQPHTFARSEWRAEVAQGFRFYEVAENLKLDVPTEDEVVAFYESAAPENIPEPLPQDVEESSIFRSKVRADDSVAMSISGVFPGAHAGELWACDMRTATIYRSEETGRFSEAVRPVECANPCRLNWADLDRDGQSELLVSDLGSFFPQDHLNGAVWKLDPLADWKCTPVIQGISRVADVQPGDLDRDGDLDLVVAEFGWRRTGRLLVLWNPGHSDFTTWKQEVIDPRHGAIDVPLIDLDGDGHLDIVALLSQEFEMVVAYLNRGEGQFEQKVIFAANEPSFGSSGIEIVDFDQDGDSDVILSNGDSFDSSYVKPFHGVRWLENVGRYPFVAHDVVRMAGVHRTVAGDIDLDGDLDLASVSLLPPSVMQKRKGLPSIIWMENQGNDQFLSHVMEVDAAHHASCELNDVDQDGDLDIVATNFRWQEETGPPVTWFINQKRLPPPQ